MKHEKVLLKHEKVLCMNDLFNESIIYNLMLKSTQKVLIVILGQIWVKEGPLCQKSKNMGINRLILTRILRMYAFYLIKI